MPNFAEKRAVVSEKRVLGPGLSARRSRLVFGTAALSESSNSFSLLDRAFDLGCTVFDTARIYQNGRSEECIGAWIASRRRGASALVVTKGCHPNHEGPRLSAESIENDVVASLRALRLETLGVFLLHRDEPSLPVEPIIDALEDLKCKGYLRAYGSSNWTTKRIQDANDYARSRGFSGFTVSSPQFSLGRWKRPPWPGCHTISGDEGARERCWYRSTTLSLLCWASLAGGLYTSRNYRAISEGRNLGHPSSYVSDESLQALRRAGQIAMSKGASVEAVALAYVLAEFPQAFAIFSCSTAEGLALNISALETRLTSSERAFLAGSQEVLHEQE